MRWVGLIGAALVAIVAVITIVGYSLPVKHVASRTVTLKQPSSVVWQTITDVQAMPQWRADVKSVEIVGQGAAGPTWREVGSDRITFETAESVTQQRLVARIADKALPFGGSWTYELKPAGDGTELTIREDGEVYNPIFRFVSRFVFGHHATIDSYIKSLEARLATSGRG